MLNNLKVLVDERYKQLNPKKYFLKGLGDIAKYIKANKDRHYYVIGDYDVDGVMATSILVLTLRFFGYDVEYYIPHRFTDGYGANPGIINNVPEGSVIILVDNGIVAFDAVNKAKEKGCNVIILDHHLKSDLGILPDADFIIDPNAIEGQCEFTAYCGAGLAFKLCEVLGVPFLNELGALAAFATIADCVSLTGENWYIAQKLKYADSNIGLAALCEVMGDELHDEGAAGFKICPAINAAGRLLDDGATLSVELMLCEDVIEAKEMAQKLKALNEDRKMLVDISVAKAEQVLPDFKKSIIVKEKIPEGIVGIVAGKLSEKYHVPVICCTELEDGRIKGSARSEGINHLKKILDGCKEYLQRYGGHAAAAGLTLSAENFEAFQKKFEELCEVEPEVTAEEDIIEISPNEIGEAIDILKKAAPYGQDNPRFLFKVDTLLDEKKPFAPLGKYLKLIDQNKVSIMCFDNIPDITDIRGGEYVEVIGYPALNMYKGRTSLQMEAVKANIIY